MILWQIYIKIISSIFSSYYSLTPKDPTLLLLWCHNDTELLYRQYSANLVRNVLSSLDKVKVCCDVCGEARCAWPVLINKASISCYYQPLTVCLSNSDNINNVTFRHDHPHSLTWLAGWRYWRVTFSSESIQRTGWECRDLNSRESGGWWPCCLAGWLAGWRQKKHFFKTHRVS